ncbi:type IV pilus biogenesis/stability protein PilW [Duffyella gerundensis]|uniref:type IV pilus biogenesis/stability protein PilW n=1 Tax=Duffyella TaxID=3026546 RepID=UPI003F6DD079
MHKGRLLFLLWLCLVVSGCVQNQHRDAAQARLQLGLAWLEMADYAAAERNLLRAQAASPADFRVQLALARLRQAQGDLAQARHHYQQARNVAPNEGHVLNNYGAFLCGLGQYDEAHQQFIRARKLNQPGINADSLALAGFCDLQRDKLDQAKQQLTAALDADRQKSVPMLAEAERRFGKREWGKTRLLLDIYQRSLPASAESLWLEIRFAALHGDILNVTRYGDQLARNFPQSIQHQHFLANEY